MSKFETLASRMSEDESIGRRVVHSLSSIVALPYVVGLLEWHEVQILAGVGFFVIFLLEVDRLVLGNSLLDPMYRDYEEESPAGYAYAMTGMFLAVLLPFLPFVTPSMAVAAIFILALADPVIGLLSPNRLMRVKPVSLLVGMFVVSFAVAVGADQLLPDVLDSVSPVEAPLGNEFPEVDIGYVEAVGAGIGATFADGVKFRVGGDRPIEIVEPGMDIKGYVVDDNVTIPVYSCLLMGVFGLIPV